MCSFLMLFTLAYQSFFSLTIFVCGLFFFREIIGEGCVMSQSIASKFSHLFDWVKHFFLEVMTFARSVTVWATFVRIFCG